MIQWHTQWEQTTKGQRGDVEQNAAKPQFGTDRIQRVRDWITI